MWFLVKLEGFPSVYRTSALMSATVNVYSGLFAVAVDEVEILSLRLAAGLKGGAYCHSISCRRGVEW